MDSRFYRSFNFIVKIMGLVFIVSLLSCCSSNSGGIALYSVGGTVTVLQGIVMLRNNATDIRKLNSTAISASRISWVMVSATYLLIAATACSQQQVHLQTIYSSNDYALREQVIKSIHTPAELTEII